MSSLYIKTVAFEGIDIIEVEAQVHIANGAPSLTIVGLGDKAVKESRDRIKAAISSLGLALPAKRITVNLAPSDVIKEGAHFDLPIAIGILAAMNIISIEEASKYIILGELALDGRILPVLGVLPTSIYANTIEHGLICSVYNGQEAAMSSSEIEIVAVENLQQLVNHLKGIQFCKRPEFDASVFNASGKFYGDFYDVRGQYGAKRALEIAAIGGHNILMYGPPGTGKSMLAQRVLSILPQMTPAEILQTSVIRSVAGELRDNTFSAERPFRDPHHSTSMPAMIGGGKNANPGEISLAHNGVLFLDELAEFPRQLLDSLRQPIESGYINVSRANKHVTYPAKFQLIAAMNPCKCGYFGIAEKECKKVPLCAQDYQGKISGPIMDRIDIHVQVSNFTPSLDDDGSDRGEKSEVIAKRVEYARAAARERYKNEGISLNSELIGDQISKYCVLSIKARDIMQNAIDKMDLSMRSHNKILKVARTIADLNKHDVIEEKDLFEALAYRSKLVVKG
ncbi:YifB family Mg chelatase-like AAA ATPase [Candidatus Deianiraea vastatrix]|uniref:ComM family competence protein n=1 Tax=Candidatus Deianiraea vastatrix TaxID=2163644 RepID=A0A5B8XIP4_9RICK|nr:YifB family Mg chelatase-like AAA ATPase [Candidatus Deianiraea vastatrix]QED23517.1 Putative ComM family competence protein [Candidatus Deianiraea vastatrix]